MIPYTKHEVTPEDEAAVLRALRSPYLTQGPEVEAFEAELAALAGARYAVAVNSGTAALHLAYRACYMAEASIPAISFVATANAMRHAGLEPCDCQSIDPFTFRDCDPTTGISLPTMELAVGVTLGGQPVGGEVVDACHGPIAHLGALATAFSFHPAKHVAAGEGGAILTNSLALAEECRLRRAHGRQGTEMVRMGWNYRMPEMSAALARSQLTRYHASVTRRRALAARYDAAFRGHPVIQPVPHGPDSARHLYQILVDNRDQVQTMLRARGIGTAIHYPAIPLQPYYREHYGYKPGQFPGAEAYAARTLSIPLFPTLTEAEQDHVITSLLEVCG